MRRGAGTKLVEPALVAKGDIRVAVLTPAGLRLMRPVMPLERRFLTGRAVCGPDGILAPDVERTSKTRIRHPCAGVATGDAGRCRCRCGACSAQSQARRAGGGTRGFAPGPDAQASHHPVPRHRRLDPPEPASRPRADQRGDGRRARAICVHRRAARRQGAQVRRRQRAGRVRRGRSPRERSGARRACRTRAGRRRPAAGPAGAAPVRPRGLQRARRRAHRRRAAWRRRRRGRQHPRQAVNIAARMEQTAPAGGAAHQPRHVPPCVGNLRRRAASRRWR